MQQHNKYIVVVVENVGINHLSTFPPDGIMVKEAFSDGA